MKNKITSRSVLSWIFGILLIFLAFIAVFSEPVPAFILFFMALVLLPPIIKHIYERWEFKLPRGLKVLVLSFSFVAFAFAIDTPEDLDKPNSETSQAAEASAGNEVLEISESSEPETVQTQEVIEDLSIPVVDSEVKEVITSQEDLSEKITEEVSLPLESNVASLSADEAPEMMVNEAMDNFEISIPEPIISEPPVPEPEPTPPAPNCDANYSGCVPIASDVDCGGGSGNGPAYFNGVADVIGRDVYDLDRDGDGVACE